MTVLRTLDTPGGAFTLELDEDYADLDVGALLAGGDASPGIERIKSTPSRQVDLVSPGGDRLKLYCKRYFSKGLRGAIGALLRGSRGRREFAAATGARKAGIEVARAVALAERRVLGIAIESAVFTEAVTGSRDLREEWLECATNGERRVLVDAVAHFVRRCHDRGFRHDDLAGPHILTSRGSDGQWGFTLIDLLGCDLRPRLGRLARAKNLYQVMRSLSRVGLGPGGRLRLLKSYLAAGGACEPGDLPLRKWWRSIELARKLKRGYFGRSRRYTSPLPHAPAGG